ncbi:hypothetical protein GEMRC1_000239 [Eukaryota sp. GEM-RC1]
MSSQSLVFKFTRPTPLFNRKLILKNRGAAECFVDARSIPAPNDTVTSLVNDQYVSTEIPLTKTVSVQSHWCVTTDKSTNYEAVLKLDDPDELSAPLLSSFLLKSTNLLDPILSINTLTKPLVLPSSTDDHHAELLLHLEEDQFSSLPVRDLHSFTDFTHSTNHVVSAMATSKDFIFVSYSSPFTLSTYISSSFRGQLYYSLVWDCNDTMVPRFVLQSTSLITSLAVFETGKLPLLASLTANGFLLVYDLSLLNPSIPISCSVTDRHDHWGRTLQWIDRRTLVSLGGEGNLKYWQISEDFTSIILKQTIPLSLLHLDLHRNSSDMVSVAQSIIIESQGDQHSFLITENSDYLVLDLSKVHDHIPDDAVFRMSKNLNISVVVSISVSTFIPGLVAVADGQNCYIIFDDYVVFRPPIGPSGRISVCFSPIKPSILIVGRNDGVIECWDFSLQSISTAVFSVSISSASVVKISFFKDILVLADTSGCVFLKTLSPAIHRQKNLNAEIESLFKLFQAFVHSKSSWDI